MPAVPSTVALETPADGASITAALHRDNYTELQAAVNAILAILDGGSVGQVMTRDSGGVDWATTGTAGYGTALPGTPTDGQEYILVDSTSAPTYAWRLRFNSTLAKWEFVGGRPAFAEVLTAQDVTTPGASYSPCATAGPSLVLPVAGDYIVEIGAHLGNFGSDVMRMSYDIGGTGAVDADSVSHQSVTSNTSATVARAMRKVGLTAVTLTAKYKAPNASRPFSNRWMRVTPEKLG